MIRGVHLAQVVDRHPKDLEVSVWVPDLEGVLGSPSVRVKVAGRFQSPLSGEFWVPQIGEMGVVAFPLEDPRSGVWLASIPQRAFHVAPLEVYEQDPEAVVTHHPGGQYVVQEGDGGLEAVWPDGSFFQVVRGRGSGGLLTRKRTRRTSQPFNPPQREDLPPFQDPKVEVYFRHKTGTEVRVKRDGSVEVRTQEGRRFYLSDPDALIALEDPSGSHFRITPTGVSLYSAATLTIQAAGAVTIDGATISIG